MERTNKKKPLFFEEKGKKENEVRGFQDENEHNTRQDWNNTRLEQPREEESWKEKAMEHWHQCLG